MSSFWYTNIIKHFYFSINRNIWVNIYEISFIKDFLNKLFYETVFSYNASTQDIHISTIWWHSVILIHFGHYLDNDGLQWRYSEGPQVLVNWFQVWRVWRGYIGCYMAIQIVRNHFWVSRVLWKIVDSCWNTWALPLRTLSV